MTAVDEGRMKNPDPTQVLLLEIVDVVRRSWWTLVAGVCAGLAVGLVVLQLAPKVYETSSRIAVDVEKLPSAYLAPAVVPDDTEIRLEALREAVLSPDHLTRIVEEFGAVSAESQGELTQQIRSGVGVTYSARTRSLTISFRGPDPNQAARVANTLASLFVEENVRRRSRQAGETRATLQALADSAETKLDAKREEIKKLRAQHPHETDDQRAANEEGLRKAKLQRDENRAAVESSRERMAAYMAQENLSEALDGLYSWASMPSTAGTRSTDPRSDALRRELEDLRSRYSDEHPKVKEKLWELERLEEEQEVATDDDAAAPDVTAPTQPQQPHSVWQIQIDAEKREIRKLETAGRRIEQEIATYERRLAATNSVQLRLDDLNKDLEVLDYNYRDLRAKLEAARMGELLEQKEKGSQFMVTERAAIPRDPVFPKPVRVFGAALIAGLVLFVGPLLIRRFLRPVIGSETALRVLADVPFVVSIPGLPTPAKERALRRRRVWNVGLALVSIAMLVGTFITVGLAL